MSVTNNIRTISVVGAGLAGVSAALAFLQAGFDVTLYSDRDRKSLRDEVPPTGTAVFYGKSRDYDAEIIEDLYTTGSGRGIDVKLSAPDEEGRISPLLSIVADFGYTAQAIDVRLRGDDRLERFVDQGGNFVVDPVDDEKLNQIAAGSDLTLVATGKGGLSELFAIDHERTVYDTPQRQLLLSTHLGPRHDSDAFSYRSGRGFEHYLFNINPEHGEIVVNPFHHKDIGESWSVLVFAKPGSPWIPVIDAVDSPESAHAALAELFTEYFPHDLEVVQSLQPLSSDSKSWLRGAITPTVRKPVGRTKDGHVVLAIGDTAVSVDPIAAQGAQNAVVQVALLVRAARNHEGAFDERWLTDQFEAFWNHRGSGATEVTRLFLGDAKYQRHAELLFAAASTNPGVATELFRFISEPDRISTVQTEDALQRFIEEHSAQTDNRTFEVAGRS